MKNFRALGMIQIERIFCCISKSAYSKDIIAEKISIWKTGFDACNNGLNLTELLDYSVTGL